MPIDVLDDTNLRDIPTRERLDRCIYIIKNDPDESKRWDAIYIAGEIAEATTPEDPIFDEVADLMSWVLQNETNGVVKHEACFQIAARNMRKKIPDMIYTALNDKSGIAKHEAIECLALMRAFESRDAMVKALGDKIPYVSETAAFSLKRLDRLDKDEIYKQSKIL
jgi:hypothetical protein